MAMATLQIPAPATSKVSKSLLTQPSIHATVEHASHVIQLEASTTILNPRSIPTYLPDIQTPITPLEASTAPIASTITSTSSGPTLLSIPLEIRLQIYYYVLLTHPIRHPHLSPITTSSTAPPYAKEEFHHTIISTHDYGLNFGPGISYPCTPGNRKHFIVSGSSAPRQKEESFSDSSTIRKVIRTHPKVISEIKPVLQGKIPTGLLACCKQIYEEARSIPFEENNFAFVNWFWSGIYAARQFSRGLELWQSEAMRWAAVEVLGRDLVGGAMEAIGGGIGGLAGMALGSRGEAGKGSEWSDLCILWKGVRRLELGIKGKVALNKAEIDGSSGWNGEIAPVKASSELDRPSDLRSQHEHILNTYLDWVQHGLLSMESLRCIEIEIEDGDVSRDTKISFCESLGDLLNERGDRSDGWSEDVRVVFVERGRVDEELEDAFTWYGGHPGDTGVRSFTS
jgi:hypothetical protein